MTTENKIEQAARTLINLVLGTEQSEGLPPSDAELTLEIERTSGKVETWKISITRS